jgi:hypothetical protein
MTKEQIKKYIDELDELELSVLARLMKKLGRLLRSRENLIPYKEGHEDCACCEMYREAER